MNAVAKTEQKDKPSIETMLRSPAVMKQLAASSRFITGERLARIALTEVRNTPKLLECDPMSLLGALMKAAGMGLEVGNGLGHAYLVPFWNSKRRCFEVQLIPGYRGYIHAALRGGKVKKVHAHPVFEGDDFDYELGITPNLVHKPKGKKDPTKLTHVYAVATLDSGAEPLIEVMDRDEIDGIMKRAKSDSGPWVTDYNEMARKTVVRRIAKYLPMNEDLAEMIALDNKVDEQKPQENWAVIDAGYTPAALEHDPAKINAERNAAPSAPRTHDEAALDAVDREEAIQALGIASAEVKKRGGDPNFILGFGPDQIGAISTGDLWAHVDRLKGWNP